MTTILVVEDEPAVAEVTALILKDDGYTVEIAHDGIDALQKMAEQRPELVICDSMMPRMDGRELVRTIRADPDFNAVKIIIMSAHRPSLEVDGVDAKLAKPFDLDAISTLVASILKEE